MTTSIAGFQYRVNHRAAAATVRRPARVGAASAAAGHAVAAAQAATDPAPARDDAGPRMRDGLAGLLLYGGFVALLALVA